MPARDRERLQTSPREVKCPISHGFLIGIRSVSGHSRLSVLGLAGIQGIVFHRSLHGAVSSVDSTPMFSYC